MRLPNSILRRQRTALLIGNRDNRGICLQVLADSPGDQDGFVQWTEDPPQGTFICPDTNEPGTHAGHVSKKRQQWLTGEPDTASSRNHPAWIFTHHNPASVHGANADIIGIVQQEAPAGLPAPNKDMVRPIFVGHCHFSLSRSVSGIPIAANHDVCFLRDGDTTVQSIDFLEKGNVLWLESRDDGRIGEKEPA